MKGADLAIYLILTAIIGIGGYTIYGLINEEAAAPLNAITTGSTDSGDVAIELTPIKIDNKNLVLSIAINTHSVELSQFDLNRITTLQYDGKVAYPADAPEIEGHHSSGNMIFNVDGKLKDFTVIIKGVPKIEERVYRWTR